MSQERVGGAIGVASDYVLRGISQNNAEPAWQADLHARLGRAWTVGLWGSQLQLQPRQRTYELDSYLQWHQALPLDLDLTLGVTHYAYPGDPRQIDYDYDELSLSVGWRDQLFTLLACTPDGSYYSSHGKVVERNRQACNAELSLHRALDSRFDVRAGAGYYELRGLEHASYSYGSATLGWHYGKWRSDLSLIAVQSVSHRWYTEGPRGGPVTLTVLWSF